MTNKNHKMRDTYKDKIYFESKIELYKDSIVDDLEYFKNRKLDELKIPYIEYFRKFHWRMFMESLNLLKCEYSFGKSNDEIKNTYLEALDYMEKGWQKTDEEFEGNYSVDDYWDVLSMLSLGYILNIEQEKLDKLVALRNVVKSRDFLLDTLCNAIQSKPLPAQKEVLYGNKYDSLWEVLQAPTKEEATKLLHKYVKSDWYKKTQANSWHGRHNSTSDSYNGYWSFESAALVKLLNIDDSSFKGLKYYPYDLLHQE